MKTIRILTGWLAMAAILAGCPSSSDEGATDEAAGAESAGGEEATAGDEAAGEEAAAEEPVVEEPVAEEPSGVPAETAPLALNEGESQIPATITVPVGCTTFNDTPTTIRVEWGDGDDFGVQVKEGNEFNTNLAENASSLRENNYGVTNEIIEETETLLIWTSSSDGREPTFKFTLLLDLAGKTWVCMQGNYGGWTREEIDAQIAACRTLAPI